MAVLVLTNGNSPGQVIEISEPETVIGRLPTCTIVLDPHGVSREHARIVRKGEQFYLADLGSRNKTKLNEQAIPPNQDQLLQQGDRISICDVELVFYENFQQADLVSNGDLLVTDADDSMIHTLDASNSGLLTSVKPELKLKAILEISRNLSSALKIDTVAPKVLESLLELFGQAERAFLVLLKADDGQKWSIRQTFHKVRPSRRASSGVAGRLGAVPADEARFSISRSIINHVLVRKKAVLSLDAGNDQNLPTSASIADLKIRSVLCAPLLTPDGQALGILQLDTSDRRQFGQDDLDVLLAVAGQAAIALQNAAMHENMLAQERIQSDLSLAQTIQRRFLPRTVPTPPGFEFFAHYHAAFEVGGDYYDFVPLGDGRIAIALGDVAGKGVAAALMMAKFSGDTRACILTERAPAAAATRLNELLCSAGIDDKFITLSLAFLDVPRRRLTFASAGHLPILIRRAATGEVEEHGAEISGFPLGITDGSEYEQEELTLEPGDIVVIYSDGVTDTRSPTNELYDSQESRRLIRRLAAAGGSPAVAGRAILQEIREFSAGQEQADDITLICFGPTS